MVKVVFKTKTKDGNPSGTKEKSFMDADSFGVQNGDLILVRGVQGPQGQLIGQNQYCFASGTWVSAEVLETKIATPLNEPFGGLPRGITRRQ